MVYIYEVRMTPSGSSHRHISSVRWKNPDNGKSGESTRQTMVDWITKKNGSAYVCGGNGHMARVGVVKKADPPYIRSYADGEWSDNLLALPRY
jgi:hypothetical protein